MEPTSDYLFDQTRKLLGEHIPGETQFEERSWFLGVSRGSSGVGLVGGSASEVLEADFGGGEEKNRPGFPGRLVSGWSFDYGLVLLHMPVLPPSNPSAKIPPVAPQMTVLSHSPMYPSTLTTRLSIANHQSQVAS
jgi:hypothetical protein